MKRLFSIVMIMAALILLTGCPTGKVYGYHGYMKVTGTSTSVAINDTPFISAVANGTAVITNELRACEIDGETRRQVDATYALVDSSAGTVTEGGTWDVVFSPSKTGSFVLKAAISGTWTTVKIPLHVYPALGLNADATWGTATSYDFDSDNCSDISINPTTGAVSFQGGIQGVPRIGDVPALTSMMLAPSDGYDTATIQCTGSPSILSEDAYVVQLTNGRFMKLRFYEVTGTYGNFGAKFVYLISDSSGAFAY